MAMAMHLPQRDCIAGIAHRAAEAVTTERGNQTVHDHRVRGGVGGVKRQDIVDKTGCVAIGGGRVLDRRAARPKHGRLTESRVNGFAPDAAAA